MIRRRVWALSAAMVSELVFAGQARSQEVGSQSGPAEEIVVTGSHIPREDPATPAPVVVITRAQIEASGKLRIGDFLQTLPLQGDATNAQLNWDGDGSTRVSLRGLGAARTLVLVDGRRMVPGGEGANDSVDLDSIPSQAIERIEILTGGASAAYGSDAIAGVVNLVTRKAISRSEVSAFGGTSQRRDGQQVGLSFVSGASSGRAHLLLSAGYDAHEAVLAGDRRWAATPLDFDYAAMSPVPGGSTAIPMGRASIPRTCTTPRCIEVFGAYPGYTGTGFKVDPTSPVGFSPYTAADAYDFQPPSYVFAPSERAELFATGDARFGEVARGYLQAWYVNQRSRAQVAPATVFTINQGLVVSSDSLYNPLGIDLGDVRRRFVEFGPRTREDVRDTFRIVTGLDGTLPRSAGPLSRWSWDASFSWARNAGTRTLEGELRADRLGQAIGPSMIDPATGEPICVTTPGDPATAIPGCVPLDLLGGAGSITPAQKAALGFVGTDRTLNQLTSVQANAHGALFRLADRPVALAAGYEYRRLSGAVIANPVAAAGESDGENYGSTEGSYDVNEVYAELSIPIASKLPFADDLEAVLATRLSSYSTFGTHATYGVGARWRIVPDVTLRGTLSTAFRAPAIGELYGATAASFESVTDPCAGGAPWTWSYIDPASPLGIACGAAVNNGDDRDQLRTMRGGNEKLGPETADVLTAGISWVPSFLGDFSLTADTWWIDLGDVITNVGPATILNSCYPARAGEVPTFCDQVHRVNVGGMRLIDYVDDRQQNVGKERTAGVDVSARYSLPTRAGRWSFGVAGTWLRYFDVTLPDGTLVRGKGVYDLGLHPPWKLNAGAAWGWKGLGAGLATRVIGASDECANPANDTSIGGLCYLEEAAAAKVGRPVAKRRIDPWAATDVFVSYDVRFSRAGSTTIAAGVQNALDANPPRIYSAGSDHAMSDPSAYDYVGRFFYLRLDLAY